MFSKTVEFEDFNGVRTSKVFYFHLSKADLLVMANESDSMQARVQRMIEAKDGGAILRELREIIKSAVGVRSEDGQRFIKSEDAQSELLDSPAYDELLMELATDAQKSVDFVRQLLPEKMQKELLEQVKNANVAEVPDPFKDPAQFSDPKDNRPAYQKEDRDPTPAELMKMSQQEMVQAFAWRENRNK